MDEITLLHVDDDAAFADLAGAALGREEGLEVVSTTEPTEAVDRIEEVDADCVVSDYQMPEMDGLDVLQTVRERYPDLPFVLFTGKGSEEIASEAVSKGVDDYLQKEGSPEQFELLANRVRNLVSRRRAEQARAESERKLSRLVSNIPGMAYRSLNEPTWNDVYVSEGAEELTGYTAEELVEGDVVWDEDISHPDNQGEFWEHVQQKLDEREHFELTYRIVTADGETKWVWERGRGVYEDGEAVAIEGFISDVTDRVEMENELRELNDRVSALHQVATELADVDDAQAVYESAVAAAEDVLGFPGSYVAEADDGGFAMCATSTAVHADDFADLPLSGAARAAFERGEPLLVEDAAAHPDTEPSDDFAAGIALPIDDRGVFQALAVQPDGVDGDDLELSQLLMAHVTEALDHIDTRESLRAERDRFATLFENVPDPTVRFEFQDGEPVVQAVNAAFEETFGYDVETARGRSIDDLVVPEDRADVGRNINERLMDGEHVEREVVREGADGERRRFLFRSVAVDETDDPVVGFGMYRDVGDESG